MSEPSHDKTVRNALKVFNEAKERESLEDLIAEEEEEAKEVVEMLDESIQSGEKVLAEIEKSQSLMDDATKDWDGTYEDNDRHEILTEQLEVHRKRTVEMVAALKKEATMVPKRAKMAAIERNFFN